MICLAEIMYNISKFTTFLTLVVVLRNTIGVYSNIEELIYY